MSHWVSIKLQLNDKDILVQALTRMGFEVEEGNFTISEYGKSAQADVRIDPSLGFSMQADGTYNIVGDFYHCKTEKARSFYQKEELFQQQLNVAYAIEDTTAKLQNLNMGFEITENIEGVVGADGMIRLVAVSYS
jgi:hypothetical protein